MYEESVEANTSLDVNNDGDFTAEIDSTKNRSPESSTKLRSSEQNVNYYSHSQALIVAKNLQDENTVDDALHTLKLWLEKGECTEQNVDTFYSLIQEVCSLTNSLQQKKEECKDRISKKRSESVQYDQNSTVLLDIMKAIFNLVHKENVWDLFTEAQKLDIKKTSTNFFSDRCPKNEELQRELEKLREEKLRLRSQLEESKEEENKLRSKIASSSNDSKEPHKAAHSIQRQGHLIALISPFLYDHRKTGQTLSVIISYLENLGFGVSQQEIEDILVSNPSIFEARLCKEGTSEEKRWIFCGFER